MARRRFDALRTTLGASLTSSATSVTFGAALTHSNGVDVPTIAAPDYVPLTILDAGLLSEIVWLTDYTEGDTTGTIVRAMEGTAGVSHSSGAKVQQGPTVMDGKLGGFEPGAGRPVALVPPTVKLRGANIVPQDTSGSDQWATLYEGWASKWPTLVKPQIDLAASVGCNAIRLIGDVQGPVAGDISIEDYVSAYEQFVDYCATLGIHVYACLAAADNWDGVTADTALPVMRAQAAMLETKPNVIGIDVVQEIGGSPSLWSGSTQHDFIAYLFDSLREVTTLPLTCSGTASSYSSSALWHDSTVTDLADVLDFYDFHPYYDALDPADVDAFDAANTAGLPMIMGEYGHTSAGGVDYHENAALIQQRPDCVGGFIWAITDNVSSGTGSDWGLFDYTFVERTVVSTVFRKVPTTTGPHPMAGPQIASDSGAMPQRGRIQFTGDVTVTDDPDDDLTVIDFTGGGGGGGASLVPLTTLDDSGNLVFVIIEDGSLVTVEV